MARMSRRYNEVLYRLESLGWEYNEERAMGDFELQQALGDREQKGVHSIPQSCIAEYNK